MQPNDQLHSESFDPSELRERMLARLKQAETIVSSGAAKNLIVFTLIPNPDDPEQLAMSVQSVVTSSHILDVSLFILDFLEEVLRESGMDESWLAAALQPPTPGEKPS
jgi:hypothetical protein